MYLPKHFEQADATTLAALMLERPLATLVVPTPAGPTTQTNPIT